MKKTGVILLCFVLLTCMIWAFSGCNNGKVPVTPGGSEAHTCTDVCPYCKKCKDDSCKDEACKEKCECAPVTVKREQSYLLSGTIWETPAYKFVTNKHGPKIAIVGGIHGDEKAGWTAGLQLVDKFNENMYGICGEILLIPQANILADTRVERYPGRPNSKNGVATVDGYTYSDLNRSFPDGRATNATDTTIRISTAVKDAVEAFAPDYVIDLHESLHSWTQQDVTTTSLGDTLIYKNSALFMDDLIYYYNKVYRLPKETEFTSNPASKKGSFNLYFTNLYKDKVVFTIETNRNNISGQDTIALDTRTRQQLNILEALFDLAWDRVDTSDIL